MSTGPITPDEAQAALRTADRGRRQVIDQVGLPTWYWWGLAIGWIVLGVIADLKNGWVTTAATLVFGAVHSAVAPRVIDGRHGNDRLRVGRDVVGRRITVLVLVGLVLLAVLTVGVSLALHADGARHPTTAASILVAVIIVLGGPRLLAEARDRLARSSE